VFGIHNVKCFGAKGDDIVDDWAAIQNAVNALPEDPTQLLPSGGIVYLPPGTYRITQPIKVYTNGVRIVGAGKTSTVINNASSPTAPAISLAGPGAPNFISYGSVQGLGIIGGGVGIRMSAVADWLYDDILILGTGGHGIEISLGQTTTQCIACEFRRVHVSQLRNYNGFHVGAPCTTLWFINCRSGQNGTGASIYTVPLVGGAAHGSLSVIGGTYESNQYGIYLNCVYGVVISGTYFEANSAADIRLGTKPRNESEVGVALSHVRSAIIQGVYANGRISDSVIGETFIDISFASELVIMGNFSQNHATDSIKLASGAGDGTAEILLANRLQDETLDPGAQTMTRFPGSLKGITGIGAVLGNPKNLRGAVTISDVIHTAVVTFPEPEDDEAYFISLAVSDAQGTPAEGSTRAYATGKSPAGFEINLEAAPGTGSRVTVDWILIL
jgi:hypothetical protein